MQMSHDAIVCANASGDIVFWSAGAVKMFGYTPGEAIGSSLEVNFFFFLEDNNLPYPTTDGDTFPVQGEASLWSI